MGLPVPFVVGLGLGMWLSLANRLEWNLLRSFWGLFSFFFFFFWKSTGQDDTLLLIHMIPRAAAAMLSPGGGSMRLKLTSIECRPGRCKGPCQYHWGGAELASPGPSHHGASCILTNFSSCLSPFEVGFLFLEMEYNLVKSQVEKDWPRVTELAIWTCVLRFWIPALVYNVTCWGMDSDGWRF